MMVTKSQSRYRPEARIGSNNYNNSPKQQQHYLLELSLRNHNQCFGGRNLYWMSLGNVDPGFITRDDLVKDNEDGKLHFGLGRCPRHLATSDNLECVRILTF
jgi:hypothetical protein